MSSQQRREQDGRFEEFEEMLSRALPHLYDPGYRPAGVLYAALGCDASAGVETLQRVLIASIADLEPDVDAPPDSRARRYFTSLYDRYVLGLTQEKTAEHLSMSARHLQRVQAEATRVLARRLWERDGGPPNERGVDAQPARPQGAAPGSAAIPASQAQWRVQAEHELAALRMSASEAAADVRETVLGVLGLANVLGSKHGVEVQGRALPPHLVAAVNPSALRQTLITAIGQMVRRVQPGDVAIYATIEDAQVRITLTGSLAEDDQLSADELVRDIITPPGVSLELRRRGRRMFLRVRVPSVNAYTVLVVEDNPDMMHFYRRSTAGTPYRIVHVEPNRGAIEAIEAAAPDVVVLDVMLPEVDGWELLTLLHERPGTRGIPVIVCSVVKEEELAMALGASLFLSKPIQSGPFIAALDRALRRASTESSKAPASNTGAC